MGLKSQRPHTYKTCVPDGVSNITNNDLKEYCTPHPNDCARLLLKSINISKSVGILRSNSEKVIK